MRSSLLYSGTVGVTLLSGQAAAVGFGDITLHSRVGEALRAEVGIVASAQDPVDTACFSLAPMRESDLPAITSARLKLVKDNHSYRLIISGSKPVADPIFILALRAGCGIEFQRDFVLMPQAPIEMAQAAPLRPTVTTDNAPLLPPARTRNTGKNWRASEGETLAGISEGLYPNDPSRQRRMLAALKRANPDLDSAAPLGEGTPVRIPRLRQETAESQETSGRQRQPASTAPDRLPTAAPKAKPQAAASATASASAGNDRLVLGAPPADLKPGEKGAPLRESMPEMADRMQKMEATVTLLNEEIAKLNQALALTSEMLAAQQKLQAAQSAAQTQAPAPVQAQLVAQETVAPVVKPAKPVLRSSISGWIELLLSAVVGGIIVAIIAHILSLRRKDAPEQAPPSAMPAAEPTLAPRQAPPPVTQPGRTSFPPPPQPREPLAAKPLIQPEVSSLSLSRTFDDDVEVTENDDETSESVLQLAEIMLSFGRLQGAAETLAGYIEKHSPDHIQPWVMLLDLYRRGNMPQEFAKLAARAQGKFNLHVPTWDELSAGGTGLKTIEEYEHIIGQVQKTWGQQACLDYLQELIEDNRAGQRKGFPLEVVEEIALLMHVLEGGYGLQRRT